MCGWKALAFRPVAELPDLRDHVRAELPSSETVLVRGGPDSASKLRRHAERVRRAFLLDSAPFLGISVFGALDEVGPASLDGLLSGGFRPTGWYTSPRSDAWSGLGSASYLRSVART